MFREGHRIGLYTLVRKLGKGGFGEVWLAERSSQFFTKKVAVKLPHDEQVDFETIRREAQLWEEASGHPNVLPIIDADIYDGQVVIVSEYADGGSLADRLKTRGKFPVREAVEMCIGILNGLEFLHHKKIIHRDLKPQNILLQGDTPRLADFGISRAMNTSSISSVVVGTDAYMSPEAFDGKRNVQTDIWSIGVVLYQLLKGSLPFPQEHPSERMFAVLTKDFAPLPGGIPTDLQKIVSRALAKNPAGRFQTAGEMRAELQRVLTNLNHPAFAPTEIFKTDAAEETPTVVHRAGSEESVVTRLDDDEIPPTEAAGINYKQLSGAPFVTPGASQEYYAAGATPPEIDNSHVRARKTKSRAGGSKSSSHGRKAAYVILALIAGVLVTFVSSFYQSSRWAGSDRAGLSNTNTRADSLSSLSANKSSNSNTSSATPSPTPTLTPTPSPTPTPTPNINGSYRDTEGAGTLKITNADSKGFNFDLETNTGKCSGAADGRAVWKSPTYAVFTEIVEKDDPESSFYNERCTIKFRFSDGKIDAAADGDGCLFYHGAGCGIGGDFVRR